MMTNTETNPYTMADRFFAAEQRADEASERYHEEMRQAFGDDWEDLSREPEFRNLIPESRVALVSEQERQEFLTMLDIEVFEGFGN